MTAHASHPLLATRSTPERNARFAALAASQGKSVSALLDQLIDTVLEEPPSTSVMEVCENRSERVSLRLRPGDSALLKARAATRGMKPASYVVMLLHAHLRREGPVPTVELNVLKRCVNELSAIGRNLNQLTRASNSGEYCDLAMLNNLQSVQREVAELRAGVVAYVRQNLMSWEAGDA